MKHLLSWLALASSMFGAGHVHAIEEPAYRVLRSHSGFEVRDYVPYVVAEVTVPGPEAEAGNQGFRILAAYIFGKNAGQQSIAMTAPVTQAAEPVKIAMTAPVTQSASATGFVVQFTMPVAYTLETLPRPLDEQIRLVGMPTARYAVIRFSGFWTDANYQEHLRRLQALMAEQSMPATGAPIYARYNAPFVPWFLRRNEIWILTAWMQLIGSQIDTAKVAMRSKRVRVKVPSPDWAALIFMAALASGGHLAVVDGEMILVPVSIAGLFMLKRHNPARPQ